MLIDKRLILKALGEQASECLAQHSIGVFSRISDELPWSVSWLLWQAGFWRAFPP